MPLLRFLGSNIPSDAIRSTLARPICPDLDLVKKDGTEPAPLEGEKVRASTGDLFLTTRQAPNFGSDSASIEASSPVAEPFHQPLVILVTLFGLGTFLRQCRRGVPEASTH
jgi:hypothetical protein